MTAINPHMNHENSESSFTVSGLVELGMALVFCDHPAIAEDNETSK